MNNIVRLTRKLYAFRRDHLQYKASALLKRKKLISMVFTHVSQLNHYFCLLQSITTTATIELRTVVIMKVTASTEESRRGMVIGKADPEAQNIRGIEIEVDTIEVGTEIETTTGRVEANGLVVVPDGREDPKTEKHVIEIGHIATMIGTVWIGMTHRGKVEWFKITLNCLFMPIVILTVNVALMELSLELADLKSLATKVSRQITPS